MQNSSWALLECSLSLRFKGPPRASLRPILRAPSLSPPVPLSMARPFDLEEWGLWASSPHQFSSGSQKGSHLQVGSQAPPSDLNPFAGCSPFLSPKPRHNRKGLALQTHTHCPALPLLSTLPPPGHLPLTIPGRKLHHHRHPNVTPLPNPAITPYHTFFAGIHPLCAWYYIYLCIHLVSFTKGQHHSLQNVLQHLAQCLPCTLYLKNSHQMKE